MSERLVCVQVKHLDRSPGAKYSFCGVDNPDATLEKKYIGPDGKYSEIVVDAGTSQEMIEKAHKTVKDLPINVSFGEVHVKKLKDLRTEKRQGTPEETII